METNTYAKSAFSIFKISRSSAVFLLFALAIFTLLLSASCGTSAKQPVSETDIVSDSQPIVLPVDVSLSDLEMEVGVCTVHSLTAEGGEAIQWRSSDDSVATVDATGTVTGIGVGECEVTAENEFGRTASCHVTVKKSVFITIDDGPYKQCAAILKKLKKHDVKATFFVVETYNIAILKDMHKDGHYVGLHTYTHDFSKCYKTEYSYFAGLEKLKDLVEKYTGYRPNIIRFPGGTSNTVMDMVGMRRMVNGADDLGYRVFDWSVSSGDASKNVVSAQQVSYNVLRSCFHDVEIVLMHDKDTTPKALDLIIPTLKNRGYVFETLDHYAENSYRTQTWYEKSRGEDTFPCEELKLNKESVQLTEKETTTLSATRKPKKSTDYIRFVSDDPAVASVTLEGVITGNKPGTTNIRAIASSGVEAVCVVTVTPSAESGTASE